MKKVTDLSQLDLSKQYTYADYLNWCFKERVELIKGWIYKMSPAPKRIHQKVEGVLFHRMYSFAERQNCEVYSAPFDVRLQKTTGDDRAINTVVQPDICVICDVSKLDDAGCLGAPDWIVEILSDSTAKKDYNEKFNLYEENGVREYWIVNPYSKSVEVFALRGATYQSLDIFNENRGHTYVQGALFPELQIPLAEVFA